MREKELLPPETCEDPADLSPDELKERKAERLPVSITESIEAFHSDDKLKALMTESTVSPEAHTKIKYLCLAVSSADFVKCVLASRKEVEQHFAGLAREEEIRCLCTMY